MSTNESPRKKTVFCTDETTREDVKGFLEIPQIKEINRVVETIRAQDKPQPVDVDALHSVCVHSATAFVIMCRRLVSLLKEHFGEVPRTNANQPDLVDWDVLLKAFLLDAVIFVGELDKMTTPQIRQQVALFRQSVDNVLKAAVIAFPWVMRDPTEEEQHGTRHQFKIMYEKFNEHYSQVFV